MEQCTSAGFALDFDRPAMLLHDAVSDRQSKAGALARRFGREERIVDAGQSDPRRSLPGVLDLDTGVCAVVPGADRGVPPPSMASRAFRTRFRKTCCSFPALPLTASGSVRIPSPRVICALSSWWRTSETVSSMMRFRSTSPNSAGEVREKFSSEFTISLARNV